MHAVLCCDFTTAVHVVKALLGAYQERDCKSVLLQAMKEVQCWGRAGRAVCLLYGLRCYRFNKVQTPLRATPAGK